MPLPAPFKLLSAADSKSGTTPRVLYTVPSGKQASIKTVNAANMLTTANQVTLSLLKAGVTTRLSAPSLAAGAASNLLTGTLNMGPGESLVQTSASNRINVGASVFTADPRAGNSVIYDMIRANGLYVTTGSASGTDPYNNAVYTSPDGVTWTWRDPNPGSAASRVGRSIAYGAGLFVIVGDDGFISTSPDGITWTMRTSALGSTGLTSVIYAGGRFVAVGTGAAGASIQASTDGVAWTARTSPSALSAPQVTHNATIGLYAVSTGASGSNGIHTSPDGTTWTQRASGVFSTTGVQAIGGRFVAKQASNAAAYSVDGITWYSLALPFNATSASPGAFRVVNDRLFEQVSNQLYWSNDGLNWENSSTSNAAVPRSAIVSSFDGSSYTAFIQDSGAQVYRIPEISMAASESAAFVASVIEVAI